MSRRRPRARRVRGKRGAGVGVASPDTDRQPAFSQVRRGQLRFALTFVVVAGVLFAAYAFPYAENGISERWFETYLRWYARLAGGVLGIFDGRVEVAGAVITGRYSLRIVKTCDAMEANLLFIAAIVAFPARWSKKLVAGAVGLVLLVAVNIVRICSLYFIGIYAAPRFELFHFEIWPLLLVAAAAAEFALLATWMQRPRAVAPIADGV
jgi:exosortase H (IPTLxxWG-CTERM-specific)